MLNDYFDVHLQFVLQAAPRGRRALSPGSKSPRSPTPPRPGSNKLSIPVSVFKPRGLLCTNLQLCFRLHVKLCMWVEMENVMNANEHVQKRDETIKKRMTPPIGQGIAVVRRSRSPRRRAHTFMIIWYYECGCRCWRLACVGRGVYFVKSYAASMSFENTFWRILGRTAEDGRRDQGEQEKVIQSCS